MRIVHVVPGSGGTFYCENCLRDVALVKALRRMEHDVVMVPMYLPLFVDASTDVAGDTPVFFGGINVFLQQTFRFFRKTPRWLDRVFDSRWMLERAAAREGSTSASELGPMTVSMLRGRDGNQRKELSRLVTWLREHARPDVVHISNALLLGLAGALKEALGVPVVCSLQDEDTWLDAMDGRHSRQCWRAMAEEARNVDAFVAVSHWYAGRMRERMELSDEQVRVIYLGVEVDDALPRSHAPDTPTIGYLSRLAECQGLGRLIDAFIFLKKNPALRDLRLRATGGVTAADHDFVRGLRRKLRDAGLADHVEFVPDFEKKSRHEFLKSLSVLSVPVPKGEAFGSFILEALAFGVPVVQPRAGAFPEVVEATGGGVVYDPDKEGAFEAALSDLLLNPERARALGAEGREAVKARFSIDRMAERLSELYTELKREAAS